MLIFKYSDEVNKKSHLEVRVAVAMITSNLAVMMFVFIGPNVPVKLFVHGTVVSCLT